MKFPVTYFVLFKYTIIRVYITAELLRCERIQGEVDREGDCSLSVVDLSNASKQFTEQTAFAYLTIQCNELHYHSVGRS